MLNPGRTTQPFLQTSTHVTGQWVVLGGAAQGKGWGGGQAHICSSDTLCFELVPKACAVCPQESYSAFLSIPVLICQMGRGFVLGGWLWGTERDANSTALGGHMGLLMM